jgi:gamma-glutamyl hercynylcysteine S-oxide synthase
MTTVQTSALDRDALLERFTRIRARTRELFDLLDDSLYYERPIGLRNPVVFYEGHLPAFAVNTLIKKGLGQPGIDEHLENIFARGIDPETEAAATARGNPTWPSRSAVLEYAAAADRVISEAIAGADLEQDGHPLLHHAQALWAILEHEEMHQETLAYMWHEVPHRLKRKPAGYDTGARQIRDADAGATDGRARVHIDGGVVTLGTVLPESPFAWDNECPAHRVRVDAFTIDVHDVTNADFLEFVRAGGYHEPRWWRPEDWSWREASGITHPHFWVPGSTADAGDLRQHESPGDRAVWLWRGMFELVPLPPDWPVYVSWAEAHAYARWRGLRLATEAEFHRAAYGVPGRTEERRYPWGDTLGDDVPGNFDFQRWDPEPVGMHPDGASAFGVLDLVGNGWEWTSTPFGPFPGFVPIASYPEYSADFFDDNHFVMKGAAPVTARTLVRSGFRNWFRPQYPYVYATFRCAGPA